MKYSIQVTLLGILIQMFAISTAMAEETGGLAGSIKMAGSQGAAQGSRPVALIGTNAEYSFLKTYSIGVDLAWARSFHQFEYQAAKGIDDVVVYAMDKALYQDKWNNFTVSLKLGWIFPSSEASRMATMLGAGVQSLSFKKGFGGRTNLTYAIAATEYAYDYEQFDVGGETVYNTRYRITNRLTLSRDLTRSLHWDLGGSVRNYADFEDRRTYNLFGMMTSMSYDVHKQASIDFGVSSASMDYSGYTPWAGPAVANYMFGSKGVIITFGTSIRI